MNADLHSLMGNFNSYPAIGKQNLDNSIPMILRTIYEINFISIPFDY